MILPFLMGTIASLLVLRMFDGRTRLVLATGLSVAGIILLVPFAAILYLAHKYGAEIEYDARFRLGIIIAILGATSLAGGLWLFVRAYRGTEVDAEA